MQISKRFFVEGNVNILLTNVTCQINKTTKKKNAQPGTSIEQAKFKR